MKATKILMLVLFLSLTACVDEVPDAGEGVALVAEGEAVELVLGEVTEENGVARQAGSPLDGVPQQADAVAPLTYTPFSYGSRDVPGYLVGRIMRTTGTYFCMNYYGINNWSAPWAAVQLFTDSGALVSGATYFNNRTWQGNCFGPVTPHAAYYFLYQNVNGGTSTISGNVS